MTYNLICDFCENFESKTDIGHVNDHQPKKTFEDINFAINHLGYSCKIFGGVTELTHAYETRVSFSPDDIFINLSDGGDSPYSRAQIPMLCDLLHLKYSGSGVFEVALASNKYYSSLAVRNYGLRTPQNMLIVSPSQIKNVWEKKSIIKPNSEGSSIGITDASVQSTYDCIIEQTQLMLNKFPEILVEEYIEGYDVTCFVIGNEEILLNEVLCIEHHDKLIFDNEVMGYKEHICGTRHFLPASSILPKHVEREVKDTSVKIKNNLHIFDMCRIDYRIDKDFNIFFLEINTVPAICMESQVGIICKHLNIGFEQFLDKLIVTITKRLQS